MIMNQLNFLHVLTVFVQKIQMKIVTNFYHQLFLKLQFVRFNLNQCLGDPILNLNALIKLCLNDIKISEWIRDLNILSLWS